MTGYPSATGHPCNECPWRQDALTGWLGGDPPELFVAAAQSDEPIACHLTVAAAVRGRPAATRTVPWTAAGVRQCQGAASYRANTCKVPRDPRVALGPRDPAVFGSAAAFLAHHRAGPGLDPEAPAEPNSTECAR